MGMRAFPMKVSIVWPTSVRLEFRRAWASSSLGELLDAPSRQQVDRASRGHIDRTNRIDSTDNATWNIWLDGRQVDHAVAGHVDTMAQRGRGAGGRAERLRQQLHDPTVEPFPPRANWQQIDANGSFTFWIPSDLMEEHLQGIDSSVGSYVSPAMRVDFDYGRYAAPSDVQAFPQPVTVMQDDSSGHAGTIVTYTNASGNAVANLYVGDIDGVNHLSMTAVGFAGTQASIPLLVIQSVRFPLTP